jgi:hypothetical protein
MQDGMSLQRFSFSGIQVAGPDERIRLWPDGWL